MLRNRLRWNGSEQIELLPAHILKLRWLEHRRLFLSPEYAQLVDEILMEVYSNLKKGLALTSRDNIECLNLVYDKARAFKKGFGV